ELSNAAEGWSGSVSLSLEAGADSDCPSVKESGAVERIRVEENSLRFADPSGREWTLSLREGRLHGMVSSASLSGEAILERSKAPPPVTGSAWKGAATVIGVAAVGTGAFLGVNRLLQDEGESGGSGTPTCSPRTCVAGVPGDPCQCNTTLVNGASCGDTPSGVSFAGACSPPSLPCQSDLSCNNGICEDTFGACPF
ncbi:MAG TPA: hypothetical protein VIC87_00880, partial [Vicinamibacteria bacterium]